MGKPSKPRTTRSVARYEPEVIEPKWQRFWLEASTFRAPDRPTRKTAKKFFCLDFFPFPSNGELHVGHPRGYIATDVVSRFKRMQGYDVLHPMGWDAFGLPAEHYAITTGEHPARLIATNCAAYKRELQALGCSYDWSREIATTDPGYYRWTQWIFVRLFESWFDEREGKVRPISELPIPASVKSEGKAAVAAYRDSHRLAYMADAAVNWCPALGTVLADEEMRNGVSERGHHTVVRRPMRQWMLRITKLADRLSKDLDLVDWPENIKELQRSWIGKQTGVEIDFKTTTGSPTLHVFSLRAELVFGATFLAVAPEHPMLESITTEECREKVEAYRRQALDQTELERAKKRHRKTGVFTGTWVVNPITQEQIPVFVGDYVLMHSGTGVDMGVPAHDEPDFDFARLYQLDIRPVILPDQGESALIIAVAEGEIPWLGPGRMVPSKLLVYRELEIEGVKNTVAAERVTAWLESKGLGRRTVAYKLRDWIFSRQRYWGEPIPIIHWEDGEVTALPDSQLPLLLPDVPDFSPHRLGESPLSQVKSWVEVIDPKTGRKGRRETNTMPNWAGSCWYYLRFIDPHNAGRLCDPELEKRWMPVDLYVGGSEQAILHLLYARFWHKVLFDLGEVSTPEPFKRLVNQGMVQVLNYKTQDGTPCPEDIEVTRLPGGKIVSKNGGVPLRAVHQKMSKSLGNGVSPEGLVRLYGADTLRLHELFMGPLGRNQVWDSEALKGSNRFLRKVWEWALDRDEDRAPDLLTTKECDKLVARVTIDIEEMRFHKAIASLMKFLGAHRTGRSPRQVVETYLKLLSPFAPHLCEELWERLGNRSTISLARWPKTSQKCVLNNVEEIVVQVNGRLRWRIPFAHYDSEEALKQAIIAFAHQRDPNLGDISECIVVTTADGEPRLLNLVCELPDEPEIEAGPLH